MNWIWISAKYYFYLLIQMMQKLEQEVGYTFPRARRLRWDSDVTGGKSSHGDILRKFRNREAEILIGTQMVAKGLDIPSVTLVE